ncbi:ATP-dependent RNA helicase TDRD9 [Daktulosphaira vitifoliae]|uniref:ATP-dependent RNA helicase TDRD9 n=1 Tax=Daktulosphaira vitifoliae TaxID=58002 RepID=UPI0021A9E221|nr:ATP-dependent RNA helicase TDRD9 [Daktulosphaira vitifoliae]XP_050536689.1 ATP-dependent RNA helicase TDRD9 [Daktulosphaira vitifoliae]XP_050536691.1 ATP-dependent RNA helicase TDRD9 [Daktulosphaira vitifoliae]XP_050536692.1 ATP-dependent RNA helicase TDRD9 [Daktulosphaira vitifoliae]XP_050536693.1 ATP-dependent RNA helicase TDRD9 [Daktulosphaira vitifoliae]
MLRKFARGEVEQRILPGSDTTSTISRTYDEYNPSESNYELFNQEAQNYINVDNEENIDYLNDEETRKLVIESNMSCVESISHIGGRLEEDLRDLESDEIHLFENYNYKDPSDISNNLEIAKYREKIVQTINSNSTLLITGVTGCGKSTQVPQFILDDCITRKKHCNIIVTQPRRIAAISVAKQVNKERGWRNGLLVGYQVGRKRDYDPNTTKILYCTTGILLQKIIKAKNLSEFTHIILDEVHERTLEMDFLLLVIKKLMRTNSKSVRIVLMSATAGALLCDYFGEYYGLPHNKFVPASSLNVSNKFNHKIYKYYLNELWQSIPSARNMDLSKPQIDEAGYETAIHLIKEFDRLEVQGIHKRSSVLVFLPGIYEIEEMHRLMELIIESEKHKWALIPLHSSITSEEQNRVFDQPPIGHRKIILSTNIAESSITVPDIAYVIDFCLMKQLKNEPRSNYSMLIMTWASKSNCDQRAGRVGRVADGRVYRLVPQSMYDSDFKAEETPEMLRCSLSRIVLMSKVLDMGSPLMLLKTAMSLPDIKNIRLTILTLKQVGALLPTVNGIISAYDGDITFMGKVMSVLPLEPPMSKLIYFGYIFNIMNEAIIMACGLSVKSIFSQPFKKQLDGYTQKLTWANNSCSDPIAYIMPFKVWLHEKPNFDRNKSLEKDWAFRNYIQLSAIRELYDLTEDVNDRLKRSFNILRGSGNMKWERPEQKALASKVILAGAFYPNYFIRGTSNAYTDQHEISKLMDNHDPNNTVYLTGFPHDQPKELYKEVIENLFPEKLVGQTKAHFSTSNKVYVEFQRTSHFSQANKPQEVKLHLVPGNVSFGVYVALKMYKLKAEFKIPLLKPSDAEKKVNEVRKKLAEQNISRINSLPVNKSIINEIKDNMKYISVLISHVETVGRFWVQLADVTITQKLQYIWGLLNDQNNEDNFVKASPNDLNIGYTYVVEYNSDLYRAELISFLHGPQEQYRFFLIDFGVSADFKIDVVLNYKDKTFKTKVLSVPKLAIECTFANIGPAINGSSVNRWPEDANMLLSNYVQQYGSKTLDGTIYSIINNILSLEDLKTPNSFVQELIEKKIACHIEEPYKSKANHEMRCHAFRNYNPSKHTTNKNKISKFQLRSPSEHEAYTIHTLKGPFNPLEMTVHGINRHSISKIVSIESQSVNSVLLDTNPDSYHERLFVAGNVSANENERLTLWDTTMMPNIAGMPAIICLMFSPCVEIRCNSSYTKMIGAICGLGYDPETSRPLFGENDIEITFDTVIDRSILEKINTVRMLLNKCVNPEDEEGPGEIFELQRKLISEIMSIFADPLKTKAPESVLRKYMWGALPKPRMLMPYCEDSPVNHPMAGSDVYKLLWGVKLSSKLTIAECKALMYKLCKVKRLKDNIDFNSHTTEVSTEELHCPLCTFMFSSNKSMQIHFQNPQHIENYKNAKEELQMSYTGPFTDIKHL